MYQNIFILIYLIIGFIFINYCWNIYYKKDYNKAKENNIKTDDSLIAIHLTIGLLIWPIILIMLMILNIKELYK